MSDTPVAGGTETPTDEQRECKHCGETVAVVDARQAEHVHQYGDRRCPGSGQERTDVERHQAPDGDQEALRAATGFPWCDTCHAPAVGGDISVQHAQLRVDRNGNIHAVPIWGDQPDHRVTMSRWNKAL